MSSLICKDGEPREGQVIFVYDWVELVSTKDASGKAGSKASCVCVYLFYDL